VKFVLIIGFNVLPVNHSLGRGELAGKERYLGSEGIERRVRAGRTIKFAWLLQAQPF